MDQVHSLMQGCQKSDQNYGLGDISTVLCDASQSDPSKKQWIIVLSYTGGTNDRKSQFTFHYTPSDTTPSMTFGKEDPELDYVSYFRWKIKQLILAYMPDFG